MPRGFRFRPAQTDAGAFTPGGVAGVGRRAKELGFLGRRYGHVEIIWITGGAARQEIPEPGDAGESLGSDKDQEARALRAKAKKQGTGQRTGDGAPKKSSDKEKG